MPRRAASFTQADIARAIRAAKQEGAARVTVKQSGDVVIDLREPTEFPPQSPDAHVARKREIVL